MTDESQPPRGDGADDMTEIEMLTVAVLELGQAIAAQTAALVAAFKGLGDALEDVESTIRQGFYSI